MSHLAQRNDLTDIVSLLSQCSVIPVTFVDKLLEHRGKTPYQVQAIKNHLVCNFNTYVDPSNVYYFANRGIQSKDYNAGKVKALWFALELIDDIQQPFICSDAPRVLSFVCKNDTGDKNPLFDVFYVPFGDERITLHNIVSKYSLPPINDGVNNQLSVRKIFIIVDDVSQVPKIQLPSESFQIYRYVTVAADGTVISVQ